MIKGIIYFLVFGFLLISAHFHSDVQRRQTYKTIKYLPLGDSYTIGTGASEIEAWPTLLSNHLNSNKIPCKLISNPARNGYSTHDLIRMELPVLEKTKPDFVTLLIGVNDWVRGVTKERFENNLDFILNEIEKHISDPTKIILITIPDFGVTPTGKNYSGGRNISEGINEFNAIIKKKAEKRKLTYVDVFEISKDMGKDKSLVASDGLHPSAKEYAEWEKVILQAALKLLP
jgi:acyl-CoA thioesterase I